MTDGFPNDVKLNKKLSSVEEGQELGKPYFDQLQKERMQDALPIRSEVDIPSAFDTLLKIPAFNNAVQAIKRSINEGKWLKSEFVEKNLPNVLNDVYRYHLVAPIEPLDFGHQALIKAFKDKGWKIKFSFGNVVLISQLDL